MTEEKNDQQCCDSDDNQQGCCSSSGGGKGFNWQKFIFVSVVIAACAVAAHSFISNGSGTCPITGQCGDSTAAICPSEQPVGEQAACCPSEKPVVEEAACCPSEKPADAVQAVCPVTGAAAEESK